MSTVAENETKIKPAFQLKGGLYHFMTLRLLVADLQLLDKQLTDQISQAPNFFRNASIIIDLQQINHQEEIDFSAIVNILRSKGLHPIGVTHATEEQKAKASLSGLAPLSNAPRPQKSINETHKINPTAIQGSTVAGSKLITTPIRSGQQVYVPEGDLVVTAAVSNGAEILADGNIHVYGPLRGRALAGVNGNKEARIFCKSLEAELVSIAGQFKISDDFEDMWKSAVEISLVNEGLQIKPI